jgi:hypothetical protein
MIHSPEIISVFFLSVIESVTNRVFRSESLSGVAILSDAEWQKLGACAFKQFAILYASAKIAFSPEIHKSRSKSDLLRLSILKRRRARAPSVRERICACCRKRRAG